MSEIGADKLAKIYIKMRDKLQQLDREHEEHRADLVAQMELVENEMLELCKHYSNDSKSLRLSQNKYVLIW